MCIGVSDIQPVVQQLQHIVQDIRYGDVLVPLTSLRQFPYGLQDWQHLFQNAPPSCWYNDLSNSRICSILADASLQQNRPLNQKIHAVPSRRAPSSQTQYSLWTSLLHFIVRSRQTCIRIIGQLSNIILFPYT